MIVLDRFGRASFASAGPFFLWVANCAQIETWVDSDAATKQPCILHPGNNDTAVLFSDSLDEMILACDSFGSFWKGVVCVSRAILPVGGQLRPD